MYRCRLHTHGRADGPPRFGQRQATAKIGEGAINTPAKILLILSQLSDFHTLIANQRAQLRDNLKHLQLLRIRHRRRPQLSDLRDGILRRYRC
jgi:hypothetical protein